MPTDFAAHLFNTATAINRARAAELQARRPLQFPTARITPVEDLSERSVQSVGGVADDFIAEARAAQALAPSEQLARLKQLRERIEVSRSLLADALVVINTAIALHPDHQSQCYVQSDDWGV